MAAAVAQTEINYPCPKYEIVAKKLLENIEKAKTLAEIRELFKKFAEIYTILPNLWNIWIEKEKLLTFSDFDGSNMDKQIKEIKNLAKKHFYFASIWDYSFESFKKGNFGRAISWWLLNKCLFSFQANPYMFSRLALFYSPTLWQALTYPHNEINDVKEYLDQHSPYPITSEILAKYEENKKLVEEIIGDSKPSRTIDWLENVHKIKDKKLIIENFESVIGFYFNEKRAWKLYFNYLKSIEDDEYERLLTLYSRYCRFFVDDLEIRKEYEAELIKQTRAKKNVFKYWVDRVEMERHNGRMNESRKVLFRALKVYKKNSFEDDAKKLVLFSLFHEKKYGDKRFLGLHYSWCIQNFPKYNLKLSQVPENFVIESIKSTIKFIYFNEFKSKDKFKQLSTKNIQETKNQKLSIPSPLIHYIYKNSKKSCLFKLIKSCKYFYFYGEPLLCHSLKVTRQKVKEPTYVSRSLYITPKNLDFNGLENLVITNSLNIYTTSDSTICSKLLPNITLDISCLFLQSQKLTLNEFQILTEQNLKTSNLYSIEIQRDDGTFLDIVDIINLLPTVTRMELGTVQNFTSSETSEKLSKLKRNVKLERFTISKVSEFFNCNHLIEFIKNNSTKNGILITYYSSTLTAEQRNTYSKTLFDSLPDQYVYRSI